MTRLAVDAVDLFLLENGTAVEIWVRFVLSAGVSSMLWAAVEWVCVDTE